MKTLVYRFLLFLGALFVVSACSKDDATTASDDGETPQSYQGEKLLVQTYGGSQDEEALSVTATPDGGYAVLGFTQSTDGDVTGKTATDSDYWLLKFDAEDNLLWNKTYGGTSDDRGQRIISTNDGGFAVIGYSRSGDGMVTNPQGFYDYWLLKLDSAGNLQWQKTFGFSGSDRGYSVLQTSDGGYFLSGYLDVTASDGGGNDRPAAAQHGVGEFWGIKLDAQGNKIWRRYFGGTNNDRSYDAVQTQDGGFLMVGNSESDDFDITNPKGSYDFWLVKVDSDGNLEWQKNYGGSSIDIAYGISTTQDGNFVVTGDIRSEDGDVTESFGQADVWTIKVDQEGNVIWKKAFGGSAFDSSNKVFELDDQRLIISANTRSNDGQVNANYGDSDAWLLITDANGNLTKSVNFGGSDADVLNQSVQLIGGAIISVGNTESTDGDIETNKGGKDIMIIKTE